MHPIFLLYFICCYRLASGLGCTGNYPFDDSALAPELRHYIIEKFKSSFLRELNLNSVPLISSSAKAVITRQLTAIDARTAPSPNRIASEDCLQTGTRELNGVSAKRAPRQVIRHEPRILERVLPAATPSIAHRTNRSYFNVNDLQIHSIHKASIKVYIPSVNNGKEVVIRVYEYINEFQVADNPIASLTTRVIQDQYADVDVTQAVQKWMTSPSLNNGVFVKAEADGQDIINQNTQQSNGTADIILHLHFRKKTLDAAWDIDNEHSKSSNVCSESSSVRTCCRHPLTVNLDSIGYRFVLFPQQVTIYHCAGDCPVGHQATSRHAHLMQQLGSARENNDAAERRLGRCCVPTEYEHLPVVYMPNSSTVKHTTIPNVIATRCGCA